MILSFLNNVLISAASWAPTPPDGETYINIDLESQSPPLEFEGEYDWSYTEETVDGETIYTAVKGDLTPIDEELVAELVANEAATKYQNDRVPEYPQIGDQLDLLWHAIDDGTLDKTSDFYTTLKSVKDSFPKP